MAPVKCIEAPPPPVAKAAVRSKAVVLLLLINCFMYLHLCLDSVLVFVLVCISSFVIILTGKRELVALFLLSFGCLVTVNEGLGGV